MTASQYDVCRVILGGQDSAVDFAVVLQHDALLDLSTRVVAPLIPVDDHYVMDRATPMVELFGSRFLVALHLITTIPRRNLGAPVASLREHEVALKRAIDTVFFGN